MGNAVVCIDLLDRYFEFPYREREGPVTILAQSVKLFDGQFVRAWKFFLSITNNDPMPPARGGLVQQRIYQILYIYLFTHFYS